MTNHHNVPQLNTEAEFIAYFAETHHTDLEPRECARFALYFNLPLGADLAVTMLDDADDCIERGEGGVFDFAGYVEMMFCQFM